MWEFLELFTVLSLFGICLKEWFIVGMGGLVWLMSKLLFYCSTALEYPELLKLIGNIKKAVSF